MLIRKLQISLIKNVSLGSLLNTNSLMHGSDLFIFVDKN